MNQIADSSDCRIVKGKGPLNGGSPNVSRRDFLATAATAGTLAAGAPAAFARRIKRSRRKPTHTKVHGPFDPTLLKLVNRITMGFSRETYKEAESLGYEGFLEQQLHPDAIDDSEWEARLATYGYDTLDMTSQQIYNTYGEMQQVPTQHLIRASILRATYSRKQLLERMVTFWTDHFNIEIAKGQCRWLKTADDRDVIRQHALGKFPELLSASAHSAAMSFYLDNWTNVVGHAQENYAREVMELHTMGVDGGYTQGDVEEVARAFTGWSFFGRLTGGYGDFRYIPGKHDNGAKFILGNSFPPNGGEGDGNTVLDILAHHPSTARFIAKKLCKWFLGYNPPEDIVESVKQTYQSTDGDIKEMLRVILHPTTLTYLSTPKIKRPFHLMSSVLRATEANVQVPRFLQNHMEAMGHLPFYWPTPDGFPDTLDVWGGAVLPRWQFASEIMSAGGAVGINVAELLASEGGNAPGEQAPAINRVLTGGLFSTEEEALIQEFYDNATGLSDSIALEAFGLGASVPGFQWY